MLAPAAGKSACRLLLAGLALVSLSARADSEFPPYPDDPFGTRETVSPGPGRAAGTVVTHDPCLLPRNGRTPVWTLVDVVDQALCHNPQTRQAWANARVTAAQLGQAEAAYLPTVNFSLPISRSQNTAGTGFANSVPVNTGGATLTRGQTEYTRVGPTFNLNYLLLDFGGRNARVELARQTLEAANWTHAATLQTVLFGAIQAYYQLFAANASLAAAEETERTNDEGLKAATARFEAGTVALSDKLQAETAFAQARVNRQTALGNAQAALGTLANAMGLKPNTAMAFEPPRLHGPVEERERDIQLLMDEAKRLRPDLASAEAQVRAADANIASVRSNSLPTLSLVGNYTYMDSVGVQNISSWQVGVQVAMPLFTGFLNTYQIRAAEEQKAAQEANRDKLDQSVALEVWRAFYTLRAARENLANTETLHASAVQNEDVALGRYKAGVGTILEVLNAQASLANARFQRVQAHYNWRIGKAQLAQALGALDLDAVMVGGGAETPVAQQTLSHRNGKP